MAGSSSSRVILCINKCGLYLNKLKEELAGETDPIGWAASFNQSFQLLIYPTIWFPPPKRFMKERYIKKLNDHFTETGIRLQRQHLMFTDWEVDEVGRAFGLAGVEEVRELIQNYLVELGVVSKGDIKDLEAAVSPPTSNW